jgi:hypothetical protein
MLSYYVEYPRDFCNEYAVYATTDRKAFETGRPDATRISRKEAIRLGWSRPKEAKRDGEQWFGGFWSDYLSREPFETIAHAITDCARATETMLDQYEAAAEYAAAGMP